MTANDDKLRSLIAHIARNRPKLGKLKLFKLLYLIDFSAHAELGHSITGELYENFEMGPVPVTLWKNFGRIMGPCANIEAVPTALGSDEQQITAKDSFNQDLEPEEAAIASRVLAEFGNYSGNSLKDLTHKQLPYMATPRGEIIPYGLAGYLFYRKPNEEEIKAIRANEPLMNRLRGAVKAKQSRQAA